MTISTHQTVLLTGATGFFGDRYLRRSAEQYDTVYALDRVCSDNSAPLPRNVRIIRCDLRDELAWSSLPGRVDVVIHAAAALPSHDSDEIFDTDVRATLRLLHWSKAVGVKQFVHISSTAVYGAAHPARVEETQPPRACDAYNTAKIRAEALVTQALDACDVQWTVLRPKAIVGPGRLGLFGHLYDFAYKGHSFPVLGDARSRYQFLHVDDLVEAVDKVVLQPKRAHTCTFNVASNADHDIATLFQSVLDRSGHGKTVRHIPLGLALPILRAAYHLRLSPVYERIVKNLVHGSTVCLDNIENALGFVPRHNGMTALADGYDWYSDRAARKPMGTGKGHTQLWRSPLAALSKWFL